MKSDGPRVETVTLDGTTTSHNFYFDVSKTTSIQVIANRDATGTLDASVTLTTSNHPLDPHRSTTAEYQGLTAVWSTESDPSLTAITTGSQNNMYHIGNFGSRWARLAVSRNSGTGRVEVLINGRD